MLIECLYVCRCKKTVVSKPLLGDTATAAKALQCYNPQNDWLCVGCIFILCVLGFVVFARRQLPPVCGHRRSLWNWRLPPCSCTCAEGAVDGRPDTFVTLRWGMLYPPTHAWATQWPTTRIDLEKQWPVEGVRISCRFQLAGISFLNLSSTADFSRNLLVWPPAICVDAFAGGGRPWPWGPVTKRGWLSAGPFHSE